MEETVRNAELGDLAALLQRQQARKLDIVVPARKLESAHGVMTVTGAEPVLLPDGVMDPNGSYRPTRVFDEGLSAKLGVPLAYLRKMREERVDLYDANVNGWLRGRRAKARMVRNSKGEPFSETVLHAIDPLDKSFLLRLWSGEDGGEGIARAFLSDSYSLIDNLDVLMAALDGVRQSGIDVDVTRCDLTDRRMYVRVRAPQVQALAPELLRGYRSPFNGRLADENPVVFAGFVITNSETGCGAFSIVPQVIVKVCDNGMTITKEALRKVHLGSKMEEGTIQWAADTQQKAVELVTLQARDAVNRFLSTEFVTGAVQALSEKAGVEVTKPQEEIKVISKRLQFTEAQQEGILEHFIKGGQMTLGGVLNAVTSYAQTVDDADEAFDLESRATRVLETA